MCVLLSLFAPLMAASSSQWRVKRTTMVRVLGSCGNPTQWARSNTRPGSYSFSPNMFPTIAAVCSHLSSPRPVILINPAFKFLNLQARRTNFLRQCIPFSYIFFFSYALIFPLKSSISRCENSRQVAKSDTLLPVCLCHHSIDLVLSQLQNCKHVVEIPVWFK